MGEDLGFEEQRKELVESLKRKGTIKSESLAKAMLNVPREKFMAERYRKQVYVETEPFPIPPFTGDQTISAPNTYPMFYEPLNIQRGDKFLEIGTGSGYGAALASEIVGEEGQVITVERNRKTFEFAVRNLEEAGYDVITIEQDQEYSEESLKGAKIVVVLGDGTKGFPLRAPYDKICVTASYRKIPEPLKGQLAEPGRLVMPVGGSLYGQSLTLLKKDEKGKYSKEKLGGVVYVPLKGEHGHK